LQQEREKSFLYINRIQTDISKEREKMQQEREEWYILVIKDKIKSKSLESLDGTYTVFSDQVNVASSLIGSEEVRK
jgi:hypothetical protein